MTPEQNQYGAVALLEIGSRLRDQRFTLTGCTPRNPGGNGSASIFLARFGIHPRGGRSLSEG
jgi:hypothetical protein